MNYHQPNMRLYSNRTQRLYLNLSERSAYIEAVQLQEPEDAVLALLLFYTGCRLSEAINVRWQDIQLNEGIVAIRSLKKRDKHHVREIPMPRNLCELLDTQRERALTVAPVPWDRTTCWRKIKNVMARAGINGEHATPKGLRHSFGMLCAYNGIPITLCQKWLGHSDIRTTAIYYQIVGREEIEMAARLW